MSSRRDRECTTTRRAALAAWLLAPLAAALASAAPACSLGQAGGTRLDSARYDLVFRTRPATVAVGSHFAIEFAVCPKGEARAPQSARVDAHMPAHRHGMNYAAEVAIAEDGRYLATGLMFHMPGRWELVFDLREGGKTDRLSWAVLVE